MSKQIIIGYISERDYDSGFGSEDNRWSEKVTLDIQYIRISLDKEPSLVFEEEILDVDFKPKKGNKVYLITARFSTGGTFGRTHGAFQFMYAHTDYDKIKEKLRYYETAPKDDYSLPWNGYFEYLEDLVINEFVITVR